MTADEKLIIVSCDCHIGPRLKEDLREYCPQKYLEQFDDFVRYFEETTTPNPFAEPGMELGTRGHYDPHARIRDLDRDGTAAEIIFHGSQNGQPIPFIISDPSSGMTSQTRRYDVDYELAKVGRHIYNQWLADFVSVEPERHVGLAHLPMWDIDDSIAEMKWAREHGLKGINLPAEAGPEQLSRSRWGGQFKYHDPVWEPFWSAAEDLEMTMATHGGAGDPDDLPGGYPTWLYEVNELTRRPIHRLIFAGVYERHPNLRHVVTEQPGDWWRTKMNDLDSLNWMANLPKKPSDYMRNNVFLGASFQSRWEAEDAIEHGYWTNCIWGTDYPHTEGTWKAIDDPDAEPYSHKQLRWAYNGLPEDKVRAIVGLTAIDVYHLDREALEKVANRINAPTFAEIDKPLEKIPEDHGLWAFRQIGSFA